MANLVVLDEEQGENDEQETSEDVFKTGGTGYATGVELFAEKRRSGVQRLTSEPRPIPTATPCADGYTTRRKLSTLRPISMAAGPFRPNTTAATTCR